MAEAIAAIQRAARSNKPMSSKPSPSNWARSTNRGSRNASCKCWQRRHRSVQAGDRRLNLPAPKSKPAEDVTVSPVLVQILAEPGRVGGRKIGTIANAGSDLAGISKLVKAAAALGVTALLIAPVGGVLNAGRRKVTVDPTLAIAAVHRVRCGCRGRGNDTDYRHPARRAAVGAFRHCKAIAAWGDGAAVLKAARIPTKGPGVAVADDLDKAFTANLAAALGLHRAWDRAASVMASAVPLPADPRGQATPQRSERPE